MIKLEAEFKTVDKVETKAENARVTICTASNYPKFHEGDVVLFEEESKEVLAHFKRKDNEKLVVEHIKEWYREYIRGLTE